MREYSRWLMKQLEENEDALELGLSPELFSGKHQPFKQFDYEEPEILQGPSREFAVPPSDPKFYAPLPTQRPIPLIDDLVTSSVKDDESEKVTKRVDQVQLDVQPQPENQVTMKLIDFDTSKENIILTALIAGSSTAGIAAIALVIYGCVRLQKKAKAAADVEYPAYGVTGPNKESTPTGDRRLAHSAQVYHYQLTKQQIIAMESNRGERRGSISEADSDDDNEEGDYTVYECPGLAPTGEMEVKNPLFEDEPTPAATAANDQDQPPTQENNQ